MPNHLSQRAFAKAAGIKQGRVSQLVADGLPVAEDGKIDEAAGKGWIAANIDPDRRRGGGKTKTPRRPDTGIMESVSRLRGHKLVREAQLLDIELRRKNGELIDRGEAERVIFARARQERDAWLGFASRAAAVLAAEAGVDPGRAFQVLDRIIREHLAELAATPLDISEG